MLQNDLGMPKRILYCRKNISKNSSIKPLLLHVNKHMRFLVCMNMMNL